MKNSSWQEGHRLLYSQKSIDIFKKSRMNGPALLDSSENLSSCESAKGNDKISDVYGFGKVSVHS